MKKSLPTVSKNSSGNILDSRGPSVHFNINTSHNVLVAVLINCFPTVSEASHIMALREAVPIVYFKKASVKPENTSSPAGKVTSW